MSLVAVLPLRAEKIIQVLTDCFSLSITSASTGAYSQIELSEVTIIFSENTVFSETEKALIIDALKGSYQAENNLKRNVLCTIFGHKYSDEIVTAITHKVNANRPRCLETVNKVNVCSRCSDVQIEQIAYSYIDCCKQICHLTVSLQFNLC